MKKYKQTGLVQRKPESGAAPKVTDEILRIIDDQMETDDETTTIELQQLLKSKGCNASFTSILCWRSNLSWSSKGTRYCQMIREANKEKRLQWAKENVGLWQCYIF